VVRIDNRQIFVHAEQVSRILAFRPYRGLTQNPAEVRPGWR
jgi:hypothetical protein